MNNRLVSSLVSGKKSAWSKTAALMLSIAILGGCGQKGPLTLPTPQFPAPPAATPDRSSTTASPDAKPAPVPAPKK